MSDRKLVSSGSPFEREIGFSRAVRVGDFITVAGTAPIAAGGGVAGKGDVYAQSKRCLEIIVKAVEDAGGAAAHITRVRVMLTDPKLWRDAARAHGETFRNIRPATTFVAVTGFIDPDWLVEIEADAIVE